MESYIRAVQILPIAFVVWLFLTACSPLNTPQQVAFDDVLWKAQYGKADETNIRLGMIADLFHRYDNLIGMSRTDVLNMLGPSNTTFTNGETDLTSDLLAYVVGSRWSGEVVVLYISFEDDRVVETYTREY